MREGSGEGWKATIHPDDAPAMIEKWNMAVRTGTPYEVLARLRRFDGEYRWCLSRAQPSRDKAGRIVKWYGTTTDIN